MRAQPGSASTRYASVPRLKMRRDRLALLVGPRGVGVGMKRVGEAVERRLQLVGAAADASTPRSA